MEWIEGYWAATRHLSLMSEAKSGWDTSDYIAIAGVFVSILAATATVYVAWTASNAAKIASHAAETANLLNHQQFVISARTELIDEWRRLLEKCAYFSAESQPAMTLINEALRAAPIPQDPERQRNAMDNLWAASGEFIRRSGEYSSELRHKATSLASKARAISSLDDIVTVKDELALLDTLLKARVAHRDLDAEAVSEYAKSGGLAPMEWSPIIIFR